MNGKGIYKWVCGDEYHGDFVDGKKQGKGILTWDDGFLYNGDFVNDMK